MRQIDFFYKSSTAFAIQGFLRKINQNTKTDHAIFAQSSILLPFVFMEPDTGNFAYGRLKLNIGCYIIRATNRNPD